LTTPGFLIILVEKDRWRPGEMPMEKELSQEFMDKVKEVAQGPDADLLYDMVELLYERRAEYDNEPLSDSDRAAIREGREAIARGEFVTLEELKKDLGL
jgi:predicted transcriptional regulator